MFSAALHDFGSPILLGEELTPMEGMRPPMGGVIARYMVDVRGGVCAFTPKRRGLSRSSNGACISEDSMSSAKEAVTLEVGLAGA